jgi:hypothetical protein
MRVYNLICVMLLAFFGSVAAACATVRIHIDLSSQRMHVESSTGSYTWPVSTARAGYHTPRGSYAPTGMQRMHYSRKYDNSPMPYSIFFRGGYAIHGSYATGSLGRPASHGCVRLAPGNAAQLYRMVQAEGARISITGSPPASRRYASSKRRLQRYGGYGDALAYAPARYRYSGVRSLQAHPTLFPFW